MKKDLLALLFVILLVAVVINGTHIQSVDEYYLTHIDDITPESETVTISIRCDAVLDNYDDLWPELQSDEFVPPDGVILPETAYVLREGDTVFDILDRAARRTETPSNGYTPATWARMRAMHGRGTIAGRHKQDGSHGSRLAPNCGAPLFHLYQKG